MLYLFFSTVCWILYLMVFVVFEIRAEFKIFSKISKNNFFPSVLALTFALNGIFLDICLIIGFAFFKFRAITNIMSYKKYLW